MLPQVFKPVNTLRKKIFRAGNGVMTPFIGFFAPRQEKFLQKNFFQDAKKVLPTVMKVQCSLKTEPLYGKISVEGEE